MALGVSLKPISAQLFIFLASDGLFHFQNISYNIDMDTSSHSESFIAEMQGRLQAEQALLTQELAVLAEPTAEGEYRAKFPDYGRDEEDNAAEMAEYQASAETTRAAQERLKSITAALERIKNGGYGLTDHGELIAEKRLRANPAATTLA